jgi:galactofuranose transport system ATP-binding protein
MLFGATPVLVDVQLRLFSGEVHALMGQNGAGKSTLIKLLTGVLPATSGEMKLQCTPGWPASPLQAQHRGISTVYQEINLCPNLTVAENMLAGRYPRRGWSQGRRIDWRATHSRARELLARVGLDIDVSRPLADYPTAVQQLVAIARALGINARVLILDEPTSSLDDNEVQGLFSVLRRLRDEGLSILLVTHFLEQVYAIADRITVLRGGHWIGEWKARDLPAQSLVEAMIGRELRPSQQVPVTNSQRTSATPLLQADGLALSGRLLATDVRIHTGEVLGIAGLLGSGRTELARLLFGLDQPDAGLLRIDGQVRRFKHPADAVALGLALCPEDRKTDGIFADLSVRENIVIALQAKQGLHRSLSRTEQRDLSERFIRLLDIRTPNAETPVGLLSGGNQQKVVIARWLATAPRLLVLDEPTRGIDVAAKQDILDQMRLLVAQGTALVFISSEMSELVRVSERILVLRDRRAVGELPAGVTEDAVYERIAREYP